MFGLLVLVVLVFFTVPEVVAYFGPGRTLSQVTEGATRRYRPVYWFVLLSLLVLGVGFGVLLPLHWFTTVL